MGALNRVLQRKRGQEAETVLWNQLQLSILKGDGWLQKREHKKLKRNGQDRYVKVTGADFSGHLKGGQACYIECKFTSTSRFALKEVRASQEYELTRAFRDGAVAVLAVLSGPEPHVAQIYLIPWSVVMNHGGSQMDINTMHEWRLELGQSILTAKAFRRQGDERI